MSWRRSLCTAAGALLLATTVAAPVHAEGPVSPRPLDPVIDVLPPLPVGHTPYAGPVCADGDPACIDEVIAEMQDRLAPLAASCDHDAVFALAYLRVTENVQQAAANGYFADRTWLTRLDAVFAEIYFDTMDAWHSGSTDVPRAWRIALRASEEREMTGLGDFMLNMNAHINNDFPHALASVGLTAPDGTSHKPDHNAYNQRLDSLYGPVFAEEAERFDPTFDDIDVGPFDETAAGAVMRGWREAVWRHAEDLALARTPVQRAAAERAVEEYAGSQALVIKQLFRSPDRSATRDAWCRQHGG